MRRPVTLRARLTLIFAAASALVLALVGVAVFVLFSAGVTGSIDSSLEQRQRALEELAREDPLPADVLAESGEDVLQLFRPSGELLASTDEATTDPMATRAQIRRGATSAFSTELERAPGGGEARLRIFPAVPDRVVAVVAEPLDVEKDGLARLAILLAVALPLALAVASYLGYRLAGAALGPVERMRSQAAQITDSDLSERLPLPRSQDEIARLGTTFNALLDRLASAFDRERRIVSDASHELRTPLTVLSTELQVGMSPNATWEEQRETMRSALEETQRLSRLADDLLVLARTDQGKLPLRIEPLEAYDVLRDLERRMEAAVTAAGRTLRTAVDVDGGAVLLADPDRLAQALDNLVANALRHGEGTITVRITDDAGQEQVIIVVDDEGPGFGAARERAFERFSQGDPAHGGTGTGLGLAIVAAIVGAHGGTVRAEDTPTGARVLISLAAA